ncbi:MAG: HEAT repeat domain-containing protein [Kofleriaceae bacterium]|nr:HEAT repeat domain-containing protein [Kofleriaceae bacterium]
MSAGRCWICICAALAVLLLALRTAAADAIDATIKELNSSNYKSRLSAALTLAKSSDARAVTALIGVLQSDQDSALRRVAAIALGRGVDGLPDASVEKVRAALTVATKDTDTKVRASATAALKSMPAATPSGSKGAPPAVFVHIDRVGDDSKQASAASITLVSKNVRRAIEDNGFATVWPGGSPSKAELVASRAHAFIVVSTVKKIVVKKKARQAEVSCTVAIRVSPWTGRDGNEVWEANKSASASGSAKTITSNSASEIAAGMQDCLDTLADDITRRQVTPFLRKIAGTI